MYPKDTFEELPVSLCNVRYIESDRKWLKMKLKRLLDVSS